MKKTFGIILLILALLSAVNVFNKLSKAGQRHTGNRSYDTGHTAGLVTTPLLLGGVGLWLLLSSGSFQLPRAFTKILLWTGVVVGGIVGAAVLFFVVVGTVRKTTRSSYHPPASASSHHSEPAQAPTANSQSPYSVGQEVEANWGGKWVRGKITRANPGGFTFMVQLEDARFPHPIVLSTNQLREKGSQ